MRRPCLAFTTVALGGFRGLIANSLWIRANDLAERRKIFRNGSAGRLDHEARTHFVQVWLMQAGTWLITFRSSSLTIGDRWRWVQRGIEFLRDDGLQYCPKEALVYRELAWFFQHKMGQNLDDAHLYYKQAWATEMNALLGPANPNFDELLNPQTDDARKRAQTPSRKIQNGSGGHEAGRRDYTAPWNGAYPEAHAIYWATLGLKNSKKKDLDYLASCYLSVRSHDGHARPPYLH